MEVGEIWLPEKVKEDILEIEGTSYKKIDYRESRVGDFIITKDNMLEIILDLLPFGGYTDFYFLTSKVGDSKAEKRYRMPSEVLHYLRREKS